MHKFLEEGIINKLEEVLIKMFKKVLGIKEKKVL